MDRAMYYKNKYSRTRDIRKLEVLKKQQSELHERRSKVFNSRRVGLSDLRVSNGENEVKTSVQKRKQNVNSRKQALQKFKEKKEALKKCLQSKQKPPFVVGIPHHGSSPILRDVSNNVCEKIIKKKQVKSTSNQEVRNERVTRAMSKIPQGISISKPKLLLKAAPSPVKVFPFSQRKTQFNFHNQKVASTKTLTSPHTPTVLKRSARKPQVTHIERPSFPVTRVTTAPLTTIVKEMMASPLACRLDSNKLQNGGQRELTEESQNVDSPRESGTSEDSIFTRHVETRRRKTAICVQSVEDTVLAESRFHRERLENETDRLLQLSEQWQTVATQEQLPSDIVDEIDSLVGQTKLLTQDKFNQFRGLIDKFEKNQDAIKITSDDLNGFWEMMYLQVETLTKRYNNLESLKSNNWVLPEPPSVQTRKRYPTSKIKNRATSSIRLMIQAKRAIINSTTTESGLLEVRNETPRNENENSFLQRSLLSKSRKSRSNSPSPYIAMRLSSVGRSIFRPSNVKVEENDINSTPKTILKRKLKTEPISPNSSQLAVAGALVESCQGDEHEHNEVADEPTRAVKRFQLKPSVLNVPDATSNCCVLKRTRRARKSQISKYNEEEIPPVITNEHMTEPPVEVRRRSTRSVARRVTFDANAEERTQLKMPSTPYRKLDK